MAPDPRRPLALPPVPVAPVPADQLRYMPQLASVQPPKPAVPPAVRTYLRLITGGLTVIALGSFLLAALIIFWLMDPPTDVSMTQIGPDAHLDTVTAVVTILAGMALGGMIVGLVAWLTAKA